MGPRKRQISSILYLPAAFGVMPASRSIRLAVGLETHSISAASESVTHDGTGRAASARRAASSAIARASDSEIAMSEPRAPPVRARPVVVGIVTARRIPQALAPLLAKSVSRMRCARLQFGDGV